MLHAAGHNGRIVDTAGDSVLAVFASAIGAVRISSAVSLATHPAVS
jgi:class 3 adenylate cyclase